MARISKEPEVRKQEILDAAMVLFYEKGYEKTSMTDIANKIGVAQGLCYRYFPSKEILFDSCIQEYANKLADKMKTILCNDSLTLAQKLEQTPSYIDFEKDDSIHYKLFHNENSKKIHDQLSIKVCEIMVPFVAELFKKTNEAGETHLTDPETAASFAVYGQLGILLNEQIPSSEKISRIKEFLKLILKI
ncbi:TetR/AcrR family transcriptional regulator [Faecalispora sporosphaeroides]|jgi:AcrR family transcriptional regulator|uniref:TetR/AcrR family transcriptional regulator n=1 Tax=Faecalispora sporosphaeroides TaxID=1549 RepID=A0A928KWW9_9FIRM|nr:TetR/AcrR family transcriptional regulator [Faecalispora sporosphaeroides]MBE6834356.1 TetR/AcrR family transcriptional regulator [Faecalispora sporosphaeroides]